MESFGEAVVREMSECRTNPRAYAAKVEARLQHFQGSLLCINGVRIQTKEGPAAVQECVNELRIAQAVGPLHYSQGLAMAAKAHCDDQGGTGNTGHAGSDGLRSGDRMRQFGQFSRACGENISYGHKTPEEVTIGLLIDDGVESRGHRKNIMNAEFTVAGAWQGPHPKFGGICCIDYASDFTEHQGGPQRSVPQARRVVPQPETRVPQRVIPQRASAGTTDPSEEPTDWVKKETQVSTRIQGNHKTVETTTTYTMQDGSIQTTVVTQESTV